MTTTETSERMNEKVASLEQYPTIFLCSQESESEEPCHDILMKPSTMASKLHPNKNVHFSDSSTLYLYPEEPHHAKQSLSYRSADRRAAGQNALREAVRIKTILLSRPNTKSNASLDDHLAECGILKEEIVGIENLVLDEPIRALERRRAHIRVLLMEQQNQKTAGETGDDCNRRLAQLSALLTKRPALQARNRAAMAA